MSPARIPDAKLQQELYRLSEKLDRIPRARDIELYGEYSYDAYRDRYGGIEAALHAAGFDAHDRVNCGPGTIGTEALLDELRRLGEERGRPPKTSDVEADGEYSLPTYYNYFETFGDALAQARFSPD